MGTKVGLGVAAAVAAAAAAGYYFYASKGAAKHRRLAASWATKMKKEVVIRAAELKSMNKATILNVIGQASKAYATMKTVNQEELMRAARELKANWQEVKKEVETAKNKVLSKGKKATKAKKSSSQKK